MNNLYPNNLKVTRGHKKIIGKRAHHELGVMPYVFAVGIIVLLISIVKKIFGRIFRV